MCIYKYTCFICNTSELHFYIFYYTDNNSTVYISKSVHAYTNNTRSITYI